MSLYSNCRRLDSINSDLCTISSVVHELLITVGGETPPSSDVESSIDYSCIYRLQESHLSQIEHRVSELYGQLEVLREQIGQAEFHTDVPAVHHSEKAG